MQENVQVHDLGEFGLISRLTAAAAQGEGVVTGIGDDCAVTAVASGMQLITSTDMLLEDVHFRRAWHDPYRLGRKSLAVNISDIAAMGGIPRWTTLSLGIPTDLPLDFLDDFTHGFLAMAAEYGVALIGGDTCASKGGLAISVTILGEQTPDKVVRRSGARPGDDIWVTGTLGDAAMGLRLVENGLTSSGTHPHPDSPLEREGDVALNDFLLSRLLDPTPRTATGLALAESGLVTAMIDVSDGILGDFGHIAELSGVGGVIRLGNLPLSAAFQANSKSEELFPWHLPLSGGEDYELCFTAPPECREKIATIMKKCGIHGTPVGIVTSSKKVDVVDGNDRPYNTQHCGFNHFS